MRPPALDDPSMELPLVAALRSEPQATTSESPQPTPNLLSKVPPLPPGEPKKILGIDIENGTRWGWGPQGYTYSIIYAVSYKWVGTPDEDVKSILFDWRKEDDELRDLAQPLWEACDQADILLGHNFRHDWSGLQGLARDLLLPFLSSRRLFDTMRDIPKHTGPSRSLEDLCQQLGLGPKPHLSQRDWVDAFIRWRPQPLELVRHRNETDVILTERLYHEELELGWITSQSRTR